MSGTDLTTYKGKVESWETKVREAYAQVQASISPELRREVRALLEQEQQLFSETIDRKNYVIERLQLGTAYKNVMDRTGKQRGLLQVL